MIWGVLTANVFGVTPETLAKANGWISADGMVDMAAMEQAQGTQAKMAQQMASAAPLWNRDSETVRVWLIKLSFLIGVIHLSLAHLRKAAALLPDQRTLAELGWILFLWGMFGVILKLFYPADEYAPINVILGLLIVGGALAILFGYPDRNPIKRVALGLVSALLPALGAFSDTMSYIRLMAVGLASYYIADAFNGLGAQVAGSATWFAAAPILLFGHGLNIALALIAIFAHGVRLNMLEFSNNVGVQWAGAPYAPFADVQIKES
jgi:V/A-type H+-transporting ATPase subunit I